MVGPCYCPVPSSKFLYKPLHADRFFNLLSSCCDYYFRFHCFEPYGLIPTFSFQVRSLTCRLFPCKTFLVERLIFDYGFPFWGGGANKNERHFELECYRGLLPKPFLSWFILVYKSESWKALTFQHVEILSFLPHLVLNVGMNKECFKNIYMVVKNVRNSCKLYYDFIQ